jgi:hypothetical protein
LSTKTNHKSQDSNMAFFCGQSQRPTGGERSRVGNMPFSGHKKQALEREREPQQQACRQPQEPTFGEHGNAVFCGGQPEEPAYGCQRQQPTYSGHGNMAACGRQLREAASCDGEGDVEMHSEMFTTSKKQAHLQEQQLQNYLYTLLKDVIPDAELSQVYSDVRRSKHHGRFDYFTYVCHGVSKTISGLLTAQWAEGERVWEIVLLQIENLKMSCQYTPEQVQGHLKSMAQSQHQLSIDSCRPSISTSKKRAHVEEDKLLNYLSILLENLVPLDQHRQVYSSVCESKHCGFEYFIHVPSEGGRESISGLLAAQWVQGDTGMVWDVVFIGIESVKLSCHYTPEEVQDHLKSMLPQRVQNSSNRSNFDKALQDRSSPKDLPDF